MIGKWLISKALCTVFHTLQVNTYLLDKNTGSEFFFVRVMQCGKKFSIISVNICLFCVLRRINSNSVI